MGAAAENHLARPDRPRISSSTRTTRSTGTRGAARRSSGRESLGPARLPLGRLRVVPLVPRHAARVVPRPRDGRVPERAVRPGEGRPRGAPGGRPPLPAVRRAADGTAGAGRSTSSSRPDGSPVLRRHVLPEARLVRHAVVRGRPHRRRAHVPRGPRRRSTRRRATRSPSSPTCRSRRRATPLDADDLRGIAAGDRRHSRTPSTAVSARRRSRRSGRRSSSCSRTPRPPATSAALEVARRWLYAMLRGGLYDHAGGGVFRYATDEAWTLPHFEKMLPDNAMLLSVIARMYRLSPSEELAPPRRETAAFLDARPRPARAAGTGAASTRRPTASRAAPTCGATTSSPQVLSAEELALAERHLGVDARRGPHGIVHLTRRQGRAEDARGGRRACSAKLLEARRVAPAAARDRERARGLERARRARAARGRRRPRRRRARARRASRRSTGCSPSRSARRDRAPGRRPSPGVAAARRPRAARGGVRRRRSRRRRAGTVAAAERLLARALELFEDGGVLHMTSAGPLAARPRRPRTTTSPSLRDGHPARGAPGAAAGATRTGSAACSRRCAPSCGTRPSRRGTRWR